MSTLRARITRASDIEPEPAPWPTFPHCPSSSCRSRLWSASRPVLPPTADGRCPHCSTDLQESR